VTFPCGWIIFHPSQLERLREVSTAREQVADASVKVTAAWLPVAEIIEGIVKQHGGLVNEVLL
jgi:hypothetical protein